MITTYFIIGVGLPKCIPITFSALYGTFAAIEVIVIDDVLVAKIVFSLVMSAKLSKINFLISGFSEAASHTILASLRLARLSEYFTLPMTSSLYYSVIFFHLTSL